MQIEFREKPVGCLQELAVEVLYQEETAELIVPDVYPDVQAVVDASAVCCLRDQEILSGSMTASGAFQATILFTAEETGEVCVQDAYLPFSAKLSREEIRADSVGCTDIRIRSVDARILNSRKILVRVSYAVRLSVYGQTELCTWEADCEAPVQLLKTQTEMMVPVTAAEKTTTFSENIEIPSMDAPLRRVAKAVPLLQPQEQKIMDGKAVWRGELQLHLLCLLENGQLSCFDVQLPVSQYLDLKDGVEDGMLRFHASLSEFQMEEDAQGSYLVTVWLRLQAVVWQKMALPLVEDGYCVGHEFTADYEPYRIRQLLDEPTEMRNVEAALRGKVRRTVDCTAWVDFPVCKRSADEISIGAVVTMHALYYDEQGNLCGETVRGEDSSSFALCEGAVCYADAEPAGVCRAVPGGEGGSVSCKIAIGARCFAEKSVQSMRSAEVGTKLPDAEDRPSLIVRRNLRSERLWDIAKQCGATMEAIRHANGLEGDEVQENSLLLIPIS